MAMAKTMRMTFINQRIGDSMAEQADEKETGKEKKVVKKKATPKKAVPKTSTAPAPVAAPTAVSISAAASVMTGGGSGKAAARKARKGTHDIGLGVKIPDHECKDHDCPFHGAISVRGQILNGTVVSDRMTNTAVVKVERNHFVIKFQRYEKRTSKFSVHNPPCISAKRGDRVTFIECRPLSKTVSFIIVEKREDKATSSPDDKAKENK